MGVNVEFYTYKTNKIDLHYKHNVKHENWHLIYTYVHAYPYVSTSIDDDIALRNLFIHEKLLLLYRRRQLLQ